MLKITINPIRQVVTVIAWFFCIKCINPKIRTATGNAKPEVRAIHDPQLGARAFPPLNRKRGEYACPIIGDIATTVTDKKCSGYEVSENWLVNIHTGTAALNTSSSMDIEPTIHPDDIHALVAPGIPSPTLLTSWPERVLTQIKDHGTEPLINAINVHIRVSYISAPTTIWGQLTRYSGRLPQN